MVCCHRVQSTRGRRCRNLTLEGTVDGEVSQLLLVAAIMCATWATVTCRTVQLPAPGPPGVKYHLYEPQQFLMYSRCVEHMANATGPSDIFKHSLDVLFVRKMVEEMGNSVPPEEADIFVVPVFMSQSVTGRCGDIDDNLRDFVRIMESSPWFQRNKGSDHLIVADHWQNHRSRGRGYLGQFPEDWRIVFAHYECAMAGVNELTHRQRVSRYGFRSFTLPVYDGHDMGNACLPAGYSTYLALNKIGAIDAGIPPFTAGKPPHERRYDVFFSSKDVNKDWNINALRRIFACSWAESSNETARDRFFVHLTNTHPVRNARLCRHNATWRISGTLGAGDSSSALGGNVPLSENMRAMADSRFFLQLHGDTVTTDRVFNMFDTLTIPIAIDTELPHLLLQMPFNDGVVPWADMFVQVPSKEWKRNPMQSVLGAIDALSPAEVEAKYRLLQRHAADVSYAPDDTRAHTNMLGAAFRLMQKNRHVEV